MTKLADRKGLLQHACLNAVRRKTTGGRSVGLKSRTEADGATHASMSAIPESARRKNSVPAVRHKASNGLPLRDTKGISVEPPAASVNVLALRVSRVSHDNAASGISRRSRTRLNA